MGERAEDHPRGSIAGGSDERLSADATAAPTPAPGSPAPAARVSGALSGAVVAQFELQERIGAGGFGEVYRARDTRLGRTVAVKVLPEALATDTERRERFRREAVAASALNHPNICTVHDLVEAGGRYLIVMELVEGKTLYAALKEGPLPLEKLLPVALQVTEALGEAHRAGILHRDVKPGNIALTPRGQVKVLDFGLAKLSGAGSEAAQGSTLDRLTEEGSIFGTLSYMSPEQLLGKPLDGRSDLFSLGVVLYEMATGRLPFDGSSTVATADAILHGEPRTFADRPLPEKLRPVVQKLLQKDPSKRHASSEELHGELLLLQESTGARKPAVLSRAARIGAAAAAVVLLALAGWYLYRSSRQQWALEQIPEITRLVEAEDFLKAASLLQQARAILPKDPALEKLWTRATGEATVETDPPGAEVQVRPYKSDENAWEVVGTTPLKKVRLPQAWYVWKIAKPGYATLTFLAGESVGLKPKLQPEASVPPGMVPVFGGKTGLAYPLSNAPAVKLEDFLIDRTEVTNEEYRKFVDAGGYQKREYWKEPFVRDGKALSWEEAMPRFLDTTGRPGPSTWEVGSYPKGKEKHPVAGVSWYEAAAYADFAGKSLPTAYHWYRAAQVWFVALIVPGSNFRGTGSQPVGSQGTLSGFGTADMAGNVREWCWNEGAEGKRLAPGGGFGDPTYMFNQAHAQTPWERQPNYGFRCAKLPSSPLPEALARLEPTFRDYSREKPVTDERFEVFRQFYAYDRSDLDVRVEETKTTEEWTWERVSIKAAYGGERLTVHLFLPRNAAPPFQTVVYFPGANARFIPKFEASFIEGDEDFLPKSGRALVLPIYKSTFERQDDYKDPDEKQPARWRDHVNLWSKDLGRSLDYLATRKDVDNGRLAYYGFSWGAGLAPILLSVDDRFQAAVLFSGGLWLRQHPPEADPFNFATRMRTPTLMLGDRYDGLFPLEASQVPFFRLLGCRPEEKKHVVYDSSHGGAPYKERVRETLGWLDRYLGPVGR